MPQSIPTRRHRYRNKGGIARAPADGQGGWKDGTGREMQGLADLPPSLQGEKTNELKEVNRWYRGLELEVCLSLRDMLTAKVWPLWWAVSAGKSVTELGAHRARSPTNARHTTPKIATAARVVFRMGERKQMRDALAGGREQPAPAVLQVRNIIVTLEVGTRASWFAALQARPYPGRVANWASIATWESKA